MKSISDYTRETAFVCRYCKSSRMISRHDVDFLWNVKATAHAKCNDCMRFSNINPMCLYWAGPASNQFTTDKLIGFIPNINSSSLNRFEHTVPDYTKCSMCTQLRPDAGILSTINKVCPECMWSLQLGWGTSYKVSSDKCTTRSRFLTYILKQIHLDMFEFIVKHVDTIWISVEWTSKNRIDDTSRLCLSYPVSLDSTSGLMADNDLLYGLETRSSGGIEVHNNSTQIMQGDSEDKSLSVMRMITVDLKVLEDYTGIDHNELDRWRLRYTKYLGSSINILTQIAFGLDNLCADGIAVLPSLGILIGFYDREKGSVGVNSLVGSVLELDSRGY